MLLRGVIAVSRSRCGMNLMNRVKSCCRFRRGMKRSIQSSPCPRLEALSPAQCKEDRKSLLQLFEKRLRSCYGLYYCSPEQASGQAQRGTWLHRAGRTVTVSRAQPRWEASGRVFIALLSSGLLLIGKAESLVGTAGARPRLSLLSPSVQCWFTCAHPTS